MKQPLTQINSTYQSAWFRYDPEYTHDKSFLLCQLDVFSDEKIEVIRRYNLLFSPKFGSVKKKKIRPGEDAFMTVFIKANPLPNKNVSISV